jgi:hypothetical protein
MSVTPKTIVSAQLTTSPVSYYTAPVNSKGVVKKLTFTNILETAQTVTVYLVPIGGPASAANISNTTGFLISGTYHL